VTVRFARPSTAEQRARLVRTQCRLRGIHFSPEDDRALKMLKSVSARCTVDTVVVKPSAGTSGLLCSATQVDAHS